MTKEPNALTVFVTCALFFLSGLAALVYEVLWMKELSLLFGNSAQAAAATLAAFFTGVAAGNAYWGRRASKLARPLLTYGVLELCVTLSAIVYFAVYLTYDSFYPFLFALFENAPTIFTLAKFGLALVLFFPAAFFMGGTLPVMTEYLVRNPNTLGKRASVLYAINTFGAASGAIIAGFYLPQKLGTNGSYVTAMSITLLVGLIAVVIGRKMSRGHSHVDSKIRLRTLKPVGDTSPTLELKILALLSGFASLALQVLWIRMLAQVLHNSIYTYSLILSVFLIALAIGGAIARQLVRRDTTANWFIPILLTLTSLLVAASPMIFHSLTDGASYVGGRVDFLAYLFEIFSLVAVVVGVPTIAIGILLPYLFKLAEGESSGPGQTVGDLVTINTVGAILGSIAAGFILLDWIGLWSSLNAIAMLYIAAAIWLLIEHPNQKNIVKLGPIFALLLMVTILDSSRLPLVKIDPIGKNESLVKVWEGADATVAVVRQDGHLRTKLNNWYTLGGTGDMATQQMQSHLPLLLHPNPKRVFYLGLGTGITAGTALNYKIDEAVIAEISPSAIQASKEFFIDHTNDLFNDARATVIAEDGRNVLRGSQNMYDLIISDLFIPWKAGTASLYSVEHYETAHKRLIDNGLYVQWLPLYQLTQEEFAIIARSMQQVFPMVTMWRGNFSGDRPVMALVGHHKVSRLTPDNPLIVASRRALRYQSGGQDDPVPLITHYSGTLRVDDARISKAPLNTDHYPVIEYRAPVNHRLEKAGKAEWFVGKQLFEFIGPYVNNNALAADSYLSEVDSAWHSVVQGGYYLHASFAVKDRKHATAVEGKASYERLLEKASEALQ